MGVDESRGEGLAPGLDHGAVLRRVELPAHGLDQPVAQEDVLGSVQEGGAVKDGRVADEGG